MQVLTSQLAGGFSCVNLDGAFWDFTSDLAKGDTAYTTLALGAHTDNTYFVSKVLIASGFGFIQSPD